MTADLFSSTEPEGFEWFAFPGQGRRESRLGLYRHFIPDQQSVYETLARTLDWEQPEVRLFGKQHRVPRLTTFYGDEGVEYRYSGLTHRAEGWPDVLFELKTRVEAVSGMRFNTVLLNWYRDGNDSMGFHADDEAELGREPNIASLSLGGTRRFVIKRKDDAKVRHEMLLEGGSLLLMTGRFQHEWVHGVPVEKKVTDGRINLTFRNIL